MDSPLSFGPTGAYQRVALRQADGQRTLRGKPARYNEARVKVYVVERFEMQPLGGQEVDMKALLEETAARAARYSAAAGGMRVAPRSQDIARLELLGGPLPQNPSDPRETLALLDDVGSPATGATTGGRFFGFVIGGALPPPLPQTGWRASANQKAALSVMSPVAAKGEEIVLAARRQSRSQSLGASASRSRTWRPAG